MKKFFTLIATAMLCSASALAFDTWSVVGNHSIMNGTTDWAIAETANDLTTEDGVNYTLTVTDKTLEAGTTYEYKYAKDHAWTTSIPQSGNKKFAVDETAVYTITYQIDVESGTEVLTTVKTGEAGEITHTYSIAGSSIELFGASWSETSTATDMTKGADGIYTWSAKNVALSNGTISFKVVEDHSWGVAYPSSNATLSIPGAGNYDVVISFNPTTKAVTSKATAKSDVVVKYYLKSAWQEDGAEQWTWREMTEQADGTFTLETLFTGAGCNYDTSDEGSGTWMESIEGSDGLTVGDPCTYTLTPGDNVKISVEKNATAVARVSADASNTGAMFNLAGQRVSSAKGIVIMNGKKYMK